MEAFARRRAAAGPSSMRAQGGGVAVVFTAPEVPRNRDSDFPYRYDSYFHYLSGFPEPRGGLVIVAGEGATRSILFCRSKHEEREIWDGFRYGPKAARKRFGFDEAFPIEELDAQMPTLLADQPAIFYALGADARLDAHVQRWLGAVRAQARAGVGAPYRALDVTRILDEMRLVKDARGNRDHAQGGEDLRRPRTCARCRRTRPGRREYEIEAETAARIPAPRLAVSRLRIDRRRRRQRLRAALSRERRGAQGRRPAADRCRLRTRRLRLRHHPHLPGQRPVQRRRSASSTRSCSRRSAPPKQRPRPGRHFMEPHDAAVKVLAQGMIDCKLLKGSLDGVLESGAYRRFYMHRTGHWLGRDVHDCGDYREPDPDLRRGQPTRSRRRHRRASRPQTGRRGRPTAAAADRRDKAATAAARQPGERTGKAAAAGAQGRRRRATAAGQTLAPPRAGHGGDDRAGNLRARRRRHTEGVSRHRHPDRGRCAADRRRLRAASPPACRRLPTTSRP